MSTDSRRSEKVNSHRTYKNNKHGHAVRGVLSFSFATQQPSVPCFFSTQCKRFATLEKNGKSVCTECALKLPGTAFAIRRYRNMREYQLENRSELSSLMAMMADPDFRGD